ncbi:MAG: hypothetical protein FD167_3712 [bacterium]|nr:MAG: hypothetical protein FD167_3712 [bacterium]
MPTFEILVRSLCGFVPQLKDSTDKYLASNLYVMLVNGCAPGTSATGINHVSHIPALRFYDKDLADDQASYTPTVQEFKPNDDVGLEPTDPDWPLNRRWLLHEDDLVIRIYDKDTGWSELEGSVGIHSSDDYTDFYKSIPNMPDIYHNGIPVNQGSLQENLYLYKGQSKELNLCARLRLNGTKKADSFNEATAKIAAFPGDGHKNVSGPYVFTSTRYSSAKDEKKYVSTISFKVELAKSVTKVEILSKNKEYELGKKGVGLTFNLEEKALTTILVENSPPFSAANSALEVDGMDIDFELLYLISGKTLPSDDLRIPTSSSNTCNGSSPAYPRPIPCYVAIFNPIS